MADAWCDRNFYFYFLFAGERKCDLYLTYQKKKLLAPFHTERWCEIVNNSKAQYDI